LLRRYGAFSFVASLYITLRKRAQLPSPAHYAAQLFWRRFSAKAYHFQGGLDLPSSNHAILTAISDIDICLAFQPWSGNNLSIIEGQKQHFTIVVNQKAKKVGFAPIVATGG